MSYRHILLAVDIEAGSDPIGRRAADLATAFGARVSLLHVTEYIPVDPSGETVMPPPPGLERELLDGARHRLDEFAARVGLESADKEVRVGTIKSEIVRVATEKEADLIVIGRHQRHGLALFLGSTERSLVTTAPCDVLAVRVEEN